MIALLDLLDLLDDMRMRVFNPVMKTSVKHRNK